MPVAVGLEQRPVGLTLVFRPLRLNAAVLHITAVLRFEATLLLQTLRLSQQHSQIFLLGLFRPLLLGVAVQPGVNKRFEVPFIGSIDIFFVRGERLVGVAESLYL